MTRLPGDIYSINIFENSTGYRGSDINYFDHETLLKDFSHPLELRKIDFRVYPIFRILFAKTAPDNFEEIERVLYAKMENYVSLK